VGRALLAGESCVEACAAGVGADGAGLKLAVLECGGHDGTPIGRGGDHLRALAAIAEATANVALSYAVVCEACKLGHFCQSTPMGASQRFRVPIWGVAAIFPVSS